MAVREIIFRGKRENNGEWVYGFYFEEIGSFIKEKPSSVSTNTYLVVPETVGQYTGLTDKNGKKIFEGDIIKDDWGKLYQVYFTTKSCAFMVKCYSAHSEYETGDYRIGESWCDTIRVVGNIHDNPELLKGGASNG